MLEAYELTPSERELCAKAAEGRLLDLRCGRATDDAPASDGRWGSERQVRAQVLVQLLTGQGPELAASVGAVRLRGAAMERGPRRRSARLDVTRPDGRP